MDFIRTAIFGAALAMSAFTMSNAATVQTNGMGQIVGILNVDVQPVFPPGVSPTGFFDVAFVDGTCIDVFSGCDEASDFTFITTGGEANAVAALQVALGEIIDPSTIFGCESTVECFITVPSGQVGAGTSVGGDALFIDAGPGNDLPVSESFSVTMMEDLFLNDTRVFAVFTPASGVAEVPLPPTATLLLFAVCASVLFRQMRERTVH